MNIGGRVKIELDLSNYATKADFESATGVDTSDFAKKPDLANLKSDVDKSIFCCSDVLDMFLQSIFQL